jgi:ABC-type lipoprotein release transport system permease subunit
VALGLLLAYGWVFWLHAAGIFAVIGGFSAILPELHLTPQVSLSQLTAIAVTVLLPYLALGIVPAWRAATLDPVNVMRG